MKTLKMQRRGFLKLGTGAMAAVAAGAALKATKGFAQEAMIEAEIDFNHGHMFTAPLSTLLANGPQTYSIQGASGHPHSIDVDQAALDTLAAGGAVEMVSSEVAGHAHPVILMAK